MPLAGSNSRNVPKSVREGTTFSMPAMAMCSGGSVIVMRMLPSLSTSISEPLSAAIRFAPEMPASAAMNCSRNFSRANSREFFAGVERQVGGELALEQRGNALARVVQRRRDDVRRLLVGDLQNEFRQVGLGDLDAGRFQRVVQLDLFRGDALALHHQLGLVPHQHVANVVVGIGRGLRQIEMPAVGLHARFQLLQKLREDWRSRSL